MHVCIVRYRNSYKIKRKCVIIIYLLCNLVRTGKLFLCKKFSSLHAKQLTTKKKKHVNYGAISNCNGQD